MKALSIKQPWASLVVAGHKTVECRTWKTSYRGPLLICSSKGDFEINDGLIAPGGMGLGVVELVDVLPMTKADLEQSFLPKDWYADALKVYTRSRIDTPLNFTRIHSSLHIHQVVSQNEKNIRVKNTP